MACMKRGATLLNISNALNRIEWRQKAHIIILWGYFTLRFKSYLLLQSACFVLVFANWHVLLGSFPKWGSLSAFSGKVLFQQNKSLVTRNKELTSDKIWGWHLWKRKYADVYKNARFLTRLKHKQSFWFTLDFKWSPSLPTLPLHMRYML